MTSNTANPDNQPATDATAQDSEADFPLAQYLEELSAAIRTDILAEVASMIEAQGKTSTPSTNSNTATNDTQSAQSQLMNDEIAALKQQLEDTRREADLERVENAFTSLGSKLGINPVLARAYTQTQHSVTVKERQVLVDGNPLESFLGQLIKTDIGQQLSVAPRKGLDVNRQSSVSTSPKTSRDVFSQLFGTV